MKTLILAITALLTVFAPATTNHFSHVEAATWTYRLVENWAELPSGTTWGVMSAVDIDSKGDIYALERSEVGEKGELSSKVMVFDSHGKFMKSWGENIFSSAHGLRVGRDGFIWVTDKIGDQIFKFSPQGELLMTLGRKGVPGDNNSQDAFNGPSDVAIGQDGDIFVSDGESTNTRIVKLSKDGRFIKSWGTRGPGPGQLDVPHNVTMDSKGHLWVCDHRNERLEVFDQDGKYVDQMTRFGTPTSIFINKADVMYVAAGAPENEITIGTTDGEVLGKIKGLDGAHWITVDSSGAIYVAEVSGHSLLKFVKE